MKRNRILFLLTLILYSFTYFYQERGDRHKREERERQQEVFNFSALGKLKKINLPHVKIVMLEGKYCLQGFEGEEDQERIDQFLEALSHIKVKRVIEKEELHQRNDFIPSSAPVMSFEFEKGSASFKLGNKLQFSRGFYLEVSKESAGHRERKIVIAFDSDYIDTVYRKGQDHRSDLYYRRFQALYHLLPESFLDHRIFSHWMNSSWSIRSVAIDNNRNKKFKIDFVRKETSPSVPGFLLFDLKRVKSFEDALISLQAQKILTSFDLRDVTSSKRISLVKVVSTKGIIEFGIYHNLSSRLPGFYIEKERRLYEINEKQASLFRGNVQDYWDLRILREVPSQMKISFEGEGKDFDISFISKDGLFKAFYRGRELRHRSFQLLMNFLKKRASYWVYGPEWENFYAKKFSLSFGAGEFFLMVRSGEILLYHRESMQGLIYKIKDKQWPIKLSREKYFNE